MPTFADRAQTGTTTVEFAIAGTVFFMVLFGVIEFGRGLFVWNSLSEVTRRAARIAAICPINHSAIAHVAIFDQPGGDGHSPFLHGLSADHIDIEYLNADGASIADPQANFGDIRYVRAMITGYQHVFLIPFLDAQRTFVTPPFTATLPRESLGIPREGANPVCFGGAA